MLDKNEIYMVVDKETLDKYPEIKMVWFRYVQHDFFGYYEFKGNNGKPMRATNKGLEGIIPMVTTLKQFINSLE